MRADKKRWIFEQSQKSRLGHRTLVYRFAVDKVCTIKNYWQCKIKLQYSTPRLVQIIKKNRAIDIINFSTKSMLKIASHMNRTAMNTWCNGQWFLCQQSHSKNSSADTSWKPLNIEWVDLNVVICVIDICIISCFLHSPPYLEISPPTMN